MNGHARCPEEAVPDLPTVVPARRESRRPPTRLRWAGLPESASPEDPGQLARPQPGLRRRPPNHPAQPGRVRRTAPHPLAAEPTSLGPRERPVRSPRRWFHWGS